MEQVFFPLKKSSGISHQEFTNGLAISCGNMWVFEEMKEVCRKGSQNCHCCLRSCTLISW